MVTSGSWKARRLNWNSASRLGAENLWAKRIGIEKCFLEKNPEF